MDILHIDKAAFDKLASQDKPVVVVLEELASERNDIIIAKVDVDQNAEFAASFGIDAIPAVFLFKNGVEVKRVVGFMDKAALCKKLGI